MQTRIATITKSNDSPNDISNIFSFTSSFTPGESPENKYNNSTTQLSPQMVTHLALTIWKTQVQEVNFKLKNLQLHTQDSKTFELSSITPPSKHPLPQVYSAAYHHYPSDPTGKFICPGASINLPFYKFINVNSRIN